MLSKLRQVFSYNGFWLGLVISDNWSINWNKHGAVLIILGNLLYFHSISPNEVQLHGSFMLCLFEKLDVSYYHTRGLCFSIKD